MYEIVATAEVFRGLGKVKQHKLVIDAIRTEIGEMHGLKVKTFLP